MGGFVDDVELTGGATGDTRGQTYNQGYNLNMDLTRPWWLDNPKNPTVGYTVNNLLNAKNLAIVGGLVVIVFALRR